MRLSGPCDFAPLRPGVKTMDGNLCFLLQERAAGAPRAQGYRGSGDHADTPNMTLLRSLMFLAPGFYGDFAPCGAGAPRGGTRTCRSRQGWQERDGNGQGWNPAGEGAGWDTRGRVCSRLGNGKKQFATLFRAEGDGEELGDVVDEMGFHFLPHFLRHFQPVVAVLLGQDDLF